MQVFVESLGDPIWQIGVGSIALVVLVLIVVLRSPDVRLTPWQQWFLPRIIGLVCLSLFLVLSAGVVLSHGADATPTSVNATRSHASVTSTPPELPSPTPGPTPSPKPFPHLSPTPAQVLITFCDAIDQHDLNGAWGQYATRLQKERTEPPPPHGWFKIVECSIGEVSDTSTIGLLQLQTIEPGGMPTGLSGRFNLPWVWRTEPGRSHRSRVAFLMAAWISLPLSCQRERSDALHISRHRSAQGCSVDDTHTEGISRGEQQQSQRYKGRVSSANRQRMEAP